ncbi:transglutaminase-like domain-containing protein [Clostridium polynesiense]|uniref:transglutaminase-like domain-containing protein n=1 Tax=Clostridium polynesiense TaxID=1325933 RepID=UPI00058BD454|nr:transglutaminase-like domain-containing protein [Clostridium polynesiense]
MSNKNPVSLILIFIFIYPILKGFIQKYNSDYTKNELLSFEKSAAALIGLILGFLLFKLYFLNRESAVFNYIPENITAVMDSNPWLWYIIFLPLLSLIFYQVFYIVFIMLNSIIINPIFCILDRMVKTRSVTAKRIIGGTVEVPKAVCNVIYLVFILNFISILNLSPKINDMLQESGIYTALCREIVIPVTDSKMAKALPEIIDNSFKVKIQNDDGISTWEDIKKYKNIPFSKNHQIVYYNGITLEEGIKSSDEINRFAESITSNLESDRAKAREIYKWIGSNINYDDAKAQRILNNDFSLKSGAVTTFNTRKGICFDYACLYVAMSRAAGLKVRMITGEGFNGISWVSHAWNEVYLKEEEKWIKLDSTFYKGGNYFNSKRFDMDHKNPKIIGEW